MQYIHVPLWRNQMKPISVLLPLCAGHKEAATGTFDVSFCYSEQTAENTSLQEKLETPRRSSDIPIMKL